MLSDLLSAIAASSTSKAGPDNLGTSLPSGYQYRVVPLAMWAKAAGLDEHVSALAWCLASEAPPISTYPQYAWAIAETVMNAALRAMVSISQRICGDARFKPLTLGQQPGRWCSTWQRPTMQHVKCAELALIHGQPNLIARGAIQWVDEKVQHHMHYRAPETNPAPEELMRRRYRDGVRWVGQAEGIDPWILTLLGPIGVPLSDALQMLNDGRARWRMPRI